MHGVLHLLLLDALGKRIGTHHLRLEVISERSVIEFFYFALKVGVLVYFVTNVVVVL